MIKERLAELIKMKNLNPSSFAKEVGIDKQSVYNYLSGKSMSMRAMEKIFRRFPDINETWFITGVEQMKKTEADYIKSDDDIVIVINALESRMRDEISWFRQTFERHTVLKYSIMRIMKDIGHDADEIEREIKANLTLRMKLLEMINLWEYTTTQVGEYKDVIISKVGNNHAAPVQREGN